MKNLNPQVKVGLKVVHSPLKERTTYPKVDKNVTKFESNFIHKVQSAIEENLSDESFGIVELCRSLGLSRSQVHNKIKANTGLSTSIYIRSIRLKKAKYLLRNTDSNVSEVAYKVGYKEPSYFSRLFIERFGVSPSKMRRRMRID